MSAPSSDNSTHSTPPVPDWPNLPCVQYGLAKGKGPIREPKLRTIYEPIPADAETASPLYKLTKEQYNRQSRLESGYEVSGSSIATELQDDCERTGRVLYPVHIESDELRTDGPEPLIKWFQEFTEDYLNVPFHTCTLYFSGNRSIHVHVPRFVSGERSRQHLKELADAFCTDTNAKLDCGLYGRKRMFRLPGVVHQKTGVPKIEIDGTWDNRQLAHQVADATPNSHTSYAAVLQQVYLSHKPLTVESEWAFRSNPLELFNVLDHKKTVLDFEIGSENIETPLLERQTLPDDATFEEKKRWWMYNAKEFSPYALAKGGSRSVAALKVMGTPFTRREVTIGNHRYPVHAPIPAYFYGARGCAGADFTKNCVHVPLQLSKPDYMKWDAEPGDYVVIIGGKSGNSIIHEVDSWQVRIIGHALTGEDASREAALDYLQEEGYPIGSAGKIAPKWEPDSARRQHHTSPPSRRTEPSGAKFIEHRAESEGIQSLSPTELHQVACRQLKFGWNPAWNWFQSQFGPAFDPEITRREFQKVLTVYPEDYPHVREP